MSPILCKCGWGLMAFACALAASGRKAPLVLDPGSAAIEIVDVSFVDEVTGIDGNRMKMSEQHKDKFRIGVVTLKITKPPNERLTLAAADLTLHYFHGEEVEVAACEGLSVFSAARDSDRPIKMPPHRGPGFVKQTTGNLTTKSSVVYVDAIFGFIEPNISDMWIAIARPTSPAPYRVAAGWAGR